VSEPQEDVAGPLVLALDVGTSSCRASLYDAAGQRLEGLAAQRAYAPTTTADGGAELDADWLLAQVKLTIDELLAEAGPQISRVRAVGTSTFWHSLMVLDEQGRPLTPVYLWLDARSRGEAVALRRELEERAVHARTGCVLHWSYLPAKLAWLRRSQPDVLKGARWFCSFAEYMQLRLCGELAASVSMASASGLFDQHQRCWDLPLLEHLGVGRERLAPLRGLEASFDGLVGAWAERWPALRQARWLPSVGDGACSNLGAGCARREWRALMVGTSAALRVLWRGEDVAIPWGVWCYRADAGRFLLGGATNDGGSLLDWLRQTLRLPAIEEAEREVAALEPDGHGLTVLPLWGGERSPSWSSDARGAIVGLRLHSSTVEILRAALEGVALTFARIDAILRRAVPETRALVATGGALLRSPAWLQIFADALGQPVHVSAEPEGSSRGAALLALEQLGLLPGGSEALPPPLAGVYEPRAAYTARYAEALERQERLCEVGATAGTPEDRAGRRSGGPRSGGGGRC
jgi:gluconokinase